MPIAFRSSVRSRNWLTRENNRHVFIRGPQPAPRVSRGGGLGLPPAPRMHPGSPQCATRGACHDVSNLLHMNPREA